MQQVSDKNDGGLQIFLSGLGKRLKQARARTKLSQKAIADKFGMSDRTILRYEKGKSSPDIEYVWRLAELTDMSVRELMFDIEKPATQDGQRADDLLRRRPGASVRPGDVPSTETHVVPVGVFDFAGQKIPMDLLFRTPKDRIRMGGFSPGEGGADE